VGKGDGMIDMENDTEGHKDCEPEIRTMRPEEGAGYPPTSAPPDAAYADMWGLGAPVPRPSSLQADIDSDAFSSGSCEGEGDGGSDPLGAAVKGKGVLYCCGRRLAWEQSECGCCMEVTCEHCGTTYAMAMVEEDEEPGEIGLEETVVAEKIKEMSLVKDGLYRGPGILNFAARGS